MSLKILNVFTWFYVALGFIYRNNHIPSNKLLHILFHSNRHINTQPHSYSKPTYAISRNYYHKYLEQLRLKNLTASSFFPELNLDNAPITNMDKIHITNGIKNGIKFNERKTYHLSPHYYEQYLRRLNSRNITLQNEMIIGNEENEKNKNMTEKDNKENETVWKQNQNSGFGENRGEHEGDEQSELEQTMRRFTSGQWYENLNGNNGNRKTAELKSKNFEVIKKYHLRFRDIGGYEKVKEELLQCVDILRNYTKYARFNVRIPRGLILEGPPGNGKTLLAKGLAGESGCSFISVSGADFQEKYVGVGSTRIKELFTLANKHIPCIIFIDEMDALGRKRSSDGESSSNERDNTLNALLVELDGFKNNTGIFVVGATNRVDLLDSALTRPGRMDKKIYIGLPDAYTREAILGIHLKGKPYDESIVMKDLVDITDGLSGSQIENLLNEAMLYALRIGHEIFTFKELDMMINKMMAGWQPVEHVFSSDIIDHIAIHEMGHAIVGLLSKHHSKMSKVIINLSSPKTPGYTVFEGSTSNIYIRESLFEHLMILLAGRIAEEAFYQESVSTGALNDFEEALKLAQKMVMYYGMGKSVIYPSLSEKYKEQIDNEVLCLIDAAYKYAQNIIENSKDLIFETAEILKEEKILKADRLLNLIEEKYPEVLDWKL
jgi:cell division protease FtsH